MRLEKSTLRKLLLTDDPTLDLSTIEFVKSFPPEDVMKSLTDLLDFELENVHKLKLLETMLYLEKTNKLDILREQYVSGRNLSRIQIILTLRNYDNDFSRKFLEEMLFIEEGTTEKLQILEALGEIGNSSSVFSIHKATKNDLTLDYEEIPIYRIGEETIRIINERV